MDAIPITYDWFYRKSVSDKVIVGKLLDKGMKQRQRILDVGITWKNPGGGGVLKSGCSLDWALC